MNVHILARKLRSVFQVLRYPRFAGIKFRAFGMLSPKVYARIYEATMRGPDLDVLEIGAARGAATIVIAKALMSSEKRAKVVAVEKFSGGSNVDFGGKDENLARIRALFDFYGVTHKVTIFAHYLTGENAEEVKALISTEQIGLLLIDADGRLDVSPKGDGPGFVLQRGAVAGAFRAIPPGTNEGTNLFQARQQAS